VRKHRLVALFCSEQLAELKRSIDHELRQRDEDTNVVRNNVGATDHRHAVQPCRALINACHVLTGIASRASPVGFAGQPLWLPRTAVWFISAQRW
jgi:hypothetical protein